MLTGAEPGAQPAPLEPLLLPCLHPPCPVSKESCPEHGTQHHELRTLQRRRPPRSCDGDSGV